MKKSPLIIALITLISVARASNSTVLFTDNFNAGGVGPDFNNSNSVTQSGTLGTLNYQILLPSPPNNVDTWRIQHSNAGQLLSLPGSAAGLMHDFASDANTANAALVISFNINVENWQANNPLHWAQFNIANTNNLVPLDTNVSFASLFRLNGLISQISVGNDLNNGSALSWTSNALISFNVSDTAGTGSAFNGHGSRIAMTIGDSTRTFDIPQMSAGYLSFSGYSYEVTGGAARVDNLTVGLVPEPSTYALFGIGAIGMLMVLRRKKTA